MRFFMLFLLLPFSPAHSQVVLRVLSVPAGTKPNTPLYVAGSFNHWNPNDSNYRLRKIDSFYQIQLPRSSSVIQYKVTRGSWSNCEGLASGASSANREIQPNQTSVDIDILGWEKPSFLPTRQSTASMNVKVLNDSFDMPQLNKKRRVWVYLPPDYAQNNTKKYKVIYLQDGQNVFDAATSFSGEWGVDETLDAKFLEGDSGCIVVAINNGGANRIEEYSPYKNTKYGGGKGDDYVDFIVKTLKPFIDSVYRTQKESRFTAIGGSSMGGLIAFYAAVKYPNVFGKALVFSPSFWFNDSLYDFVERQTIPLQNQYFLLSGRNESATQVDEINRMVDLMQTKGVSSDRLKFVIKDDGAHQEWFWEREFGDAYDWLFKP